MLEFLFEIFGEFLLQAIIEILAEMGLYSLDKGHRKPPSPWLSIMGYGLFGLAAGGLSLLIVDWHYIQNKQARIANLVLTPLAMGYVMTLIGAWRAAKGQLALRFDRFAYGYLFALTFAVVRFLFAD